MHCRLFFVDKKCVARGGKSLTSLHNPEAHPRMEFHRNAAALIPEATDTDPGVAVMVCSEKTEKAVSAHVI